MFSSIKKILPGTVKDFLKTILRQCKRCIFYLQRKWAKAFGTSPKKPGYTFAILCIKKTVYGDMVVDNINSLHYLNRNHSVVLYCDTLCSDYLQARKNSFDFPEKIIIKDSYGMADKPWQHYKINVHIQAAWNDQIDTDADGVWHEDPVVDKNKITSLVIAYNMASSPKDILVLEKIFGKKEWSTFNHYVGAFLSLPKKFMTEKMAEDLQKFNDAIFYHPLDFLPESERAEIRRLSEEFAVSLAIQSNFPAEVITTLKTEDGPGSKKSLQSLYYGCMNRIIE
jgi:hypothetical protein